MEGGGGGVTYNFGCFPFSRSKVCNINTKITEKYSLVREVTSKWKAEKLSNVVYGSH
jgi:hypothetical protein